jgi:hypothetical protein
MSEGRIILLRRVTTRDGRIVLRRNPALAVSRASG